MTLRDEIARRIVAQLLTQAAICERIHRGCACGPLYRQRAAAIRAEGGGE